MVLQQLYYYFNHIYLTNPQNFYLKTEVKISSRIQIHFSVMNHLLAFNYIYSYSLRGGGNSTLESESLLRDTEKGDSFPISTKRI